VGLVPPLDRVDAKTEKKLKIEIELQNPSEGYGYTFSSI
jgi:hypothetical protein